MRVNSNKRPLEVEMLQGKKLVNFDIVEVEVEGEVSYSYEQVRLQKDAPDSDVVKLIAEETPKVQKNTARSKIRNIKDIEDDLVDQKQLIQFLSRGLASLWKTLPAEIKEANPYAENFELFSDEILSVDVRLDLESDQIAKIMSILKDEEEFAKIVQDEYLGKINAKV